MSIRKHIVLTLAWVLGCIALLLLIGGTPTSPAAGVQVVDDTAVIVPQVGEHDGVYIPTWEGVQVASHCEATVSEGLDWYEEGPDDVPAAEESVLYDACHYFGRTAELELHEDGSWRVAQTQGVDEGIYWRGCFTVGSCND